MVNVVTHALTGAAVGLAVPVWGALPAGVISHAILDALPHRDYATVRAAVIDTGVAVGLTAAAAIWTGQPAPILLGAAGGILPDVEVGLNHFFNTRLRFPSHTGLIPHGRTKGSSPLWAVILAASLLFILAH